MSTVRTAAYFIIIIVIIIAITTISFMQGICAYIPETNHVAKEYTVTTVYGANIISFCVGSDVLLHQPFPKYVCSAQYDSFL
jgi:hypothetical protein